MWFRRGEGVEVGGQCIVCGGGEESVLGSLCELKPPETAAFLLFIYFF